MKALSRNQKQNMILINMLWLCLGAVTFFSLHTQRNLLMIETGIILCLYAVFIFVNLASTSRTVTAYSAIIVFVGYLFYLSYTWPSLVNILMFAICIVSASLFLDNRLLIFAASMSVACQIILIQLKGTFLFGQDSLYNYFTVIVFSLVVFFLLYFKAKIIDDRGHSDTVLKEKLLSTISLYESLFAFSKDAIVLLNQKGKIMALNKAFTDLYGLSDSEAIGNSIVRFFPGSRQEFEHALHSIKDETCNNWYELTTIKNNGETMLADVTFSPILPVLDGSEYAVSCTIRDITEKRLVDEYVKNSEKLKVSGEIAAGVAHEIRNPLTVISGFIQMMNQGNGENKQYLDIITAEIERMNGIISEFLFLSKPHVSNIKLHDIHSILGDVILLMQTEAFFKEVKILKQPAEVPLYVYCEGSQLKQVFINLFKNSIEAMPDGGEISVQLSELSEKTIRVSIIDNGIGIPKDVLSRIGKPFFTTKEHGTGLGLMISERIIEQHHGSISISSESGIGTKVDIDLPFIESNSPDSYKASEMFH